MGIFDGFRRRKKVRKEDMQKTEVNTPQQTKEDTKKTEEGRIEKPFAPHKPELKTIDTEIYKKEWQVGDKLLDRFEIKKVLKGGMGVVYITLDHEWNKLFAIKTFQDKFIWNEEIINRFMEEAETWTNLERHTNIVFANFVQKIEGKPLIFLEYIEGGDLSQFIGRLNISQALDFAIQFCTGMNYAYNKLRVIHRDIKPGNVMLARDDRFRFGYAFKVTDFGLVKALGDAYMGGFLDESPSVSTGMGTWPYMPPEQFHEKIQAKFSFTPKTITTCTDIYSFGVTFYEVLVGKLPFYDPLRDRRVPSETTLNRIFTKSPTNPLRINSQIPERLDGLIMRCLEKNHEDRYSGFKELRDELMEVYKGYTGEKYVVIGKKEPLTSVNWNNKGVALEELGRVEEAIICYDKALEINLIDEHAWSNKGFALGKLGKYKESIECLDKALEIKPECAEAWNDKGVILGNVGRYEEGIECLDKALKIKPEYAEAWYNKGVILGNLGRYEDEIGYYAEALKINIRYIEAWNNKGVALGNLGRYEKEIECCDKALEINPKHVEAWANRGSALINLGKYEEAIDCLEKSIVLSPPEDASYVKQAKEIINELRRI